MYVKSINIQVWCNRNTAYIERVFINQIFYTNIVMKLLINGKNFESVDFSEIILCLSLPSGYMTAVTREESVLSLAIAVKLTLQQSEETT